jgi:hypothetical protein
MAVVCRLVVGIATAAFWTRRTRTTQLAPVHGLGRRLGLGDAAFKVYSGFSSRRFSSDLPEANRRGLVSPVVHINSASTTWRARP